MAQTWQSTFFEAALIALGVVGFFAISLLPLRAWTLLRQNKGLILAPFYGKTAYAIVCIAAAAAIWASASSLLKVSHCLLGLHCSANRAGGWLFLSSIGFWYLAFETLVAGVLLAVRRFGDEA